MFMSKTTLSGSFLVRIAVPEYPFRALEAFTYTLYSGSNAHKDLTSSQFAFVSCKHNMSGFMDFRSFTKSFFIMDRIPLTFQFTRLISVMRMYLSQKIN